jgi:hypothetical protein
MANSFRFRSLAKSPLGDLGVKQFKKPLTICLNNLSSYEISLIFLDIPMTLCSFAKNCN